MLTLSVTMNLILGQTMLEGEAIAAFRAGPLHGGTTKIVVDTDFFFQPYSSLGWSGNLASAG